MAGPIVRAVKLTQHGHELYMFSLRSDTLIKLCYVTPRSDVDPEEVQRIVNQKRAIEIGEYLKEPNVILPNAIVISLADAVTITPTASPTEVTIQFPATEGKFGYVLDGQHRLEGFKHADGIVFDLPVVALRHVDEAMRAKVFADINSKQERVTNTHLLELYYQISNMSPEDSASMDVIHALESQPDSPLYQAIKLRDDQKSRKVNNAFLKRVLGPHLSTGGALANLNPQQQAIVMKEYLKGVRLTWPEAWDDTKKFGLAKPFGIEILSAVFPTALQRVKLHCGKSRTAADFAKMLEPLQGAKLKLPGGGKITLTWAVGELGHLSSAAGKSAIAKALRDLLNAADET